MGYCCQATAQPVGPCKLSLERLAVWVTAPLPTLSYKRVLTTLVLLFGPQNAPQPPIWLFAEKERTKLGRVEQKRLFEGGAGVTEDGFQLAMWCQHELA